MSSKQTETKQTDKFVQAVNELYDEFKHSWESKIITQEFLVELMSLFIITIEQRYTGGEFKHELTLAILKKIVTDNINSDELQKTLYKFIDGPISIMIKQACKFAKIRFKKFRWNKICCCCK